MRSLPARSPARGAVCELNNLNFCNFCQDGKNCKSSVIIEQDEAGYYVAEVPALPGCLSQGKTCEEVIANIKEAIEGWLEVMESKRSFDINRAGLTIEEFNKL
ncbi:MAG: type II toxin-antitoxin system HicB family antitoxin [Acidobacteria bacterium]|nr:type II toxin-antitoxin system HicB family antitoxin [Acidobacteriota bacterium]